VFYVARWWEAKTKIRELKIFGCKRSEKNNNVKYYITGNFLFCAS
jgi:hypothetical protein